MKMPKFREWRSRPSNHGARLNLKSFRCISCRSWFNPWSFQEKACKNCNSMTKYSPSNEGQEFHAVDQSGLFDTLPRQNKGSDELLLKSDSSPSWQKKTIPDTRSFTIGCQTSVESTIDLMDGLTSDDDDVMTVCLGLDHEPVEQFPQSSFYSRCGIRTRDFFSVPEVEYYPKQSIGIQTDIATASLSRRDASVQVQLIPNFLCELFEEQTESSKSVLSKLRRREDVEKLFEEEIIALSSDPSLLELASTRAALKNDLRLLKSRFVSEKIRFEGKWKKSVAKCGEEKRIVNALNASREEYQALKANFQTIDELVLHYRHRLQQYEDQLAATNQKILNENDKELAELFKASLMKRENRVAQAKIELERRIQERALADEELKDAEQYLRDQEDTYRLWRVSAQNKPESDQPVTNVGIAALWEEVAFIKSQKASAEIRTAAKILNILEKKETLLNFKYQQSLTDLQNEKKYYGRLLLEDQARKALSLLS